MERLRIIVAGLAGTFPMAGSSLSWLQYVLGLRQLGHEVLYLEDTGAWYYDPGSGSTVGDSTGPVAHLDRVMGHFDLANSWTFIDHQGREFGVGGAALRGFIEDCDLLVHVTGAMYLHDRYLRIPRRAYVDTDPGFIQLRLAQGSKADREHLSRHTSHFSFGCNIGQLDCGVPETEFRWTPTVQPIFLPLWPVTEGPASGARFTTLVKWDASGHGPIFHDDEVFGLKDVEFLKFVDLPARTLGELEIASAGVPPHPNLSSLGWHLRDGPEVSSTIDKYRNYIQGSRGEWSIAKNCYVQTRGGWFSDRSASYLASGRPVVIQSTGFERWLPSGAGVFSFKTLDEAAAALDEIMGNYRHHSAVARELAETYFDSDRVLAALVEKAMTDCSEVVSFPNQ